MRCMIHACTWFQEEEGECLEAVSGEKEVCVSETAMQGTGVHFITMVKHLFVSHVIVGCDREC